MQRILLAELLGALSHALDLTEGQPQGHCMRCCWIGMSVAEEIGLGEVEKRNLYYTLLLKDLGCSSNAARICELYLTDDLGFKHDFKRIDGSLPQALRFVLAHTGLQAGLAERFRAILKIFQNGGEIARELVETRCQRGAEIARRMRFPEAVALGVRDLDEHWDGSGKPQGLAGGDIHPNARVALMAQVVDVFHTAAGPDAARREVAARSGGWFEPALAEAFERVSRNAAFWSQLGQDDLTQAVLALEPAQHASLVDDDYLDDIAAAFAQVIDTKSPYTHGHSDRVTLFADMIAEELGLSDERRRWLRRTALLHDIGKLGVSNSILDKPGKLNGEEWAAMKRHAAYSEEILSRIGVFSHLAFVAGAHHERLDGKGYPKGLKGDEIPFDTRIITTADIFDALTANRPYRPAMPVSNALAIMREQIGTAIDERCFRALATAMRRLDEDIAA